MYKFFIFLLFFLSGAQVAFATPLLSVKVEAGSYKVGQEVRARILLDTEKNSVNSFEASIGYNQKKLKFVGYGDGKSITPLWVSAPRVVDSKIYFSAIIPGGVSATYDANSTEPRSLDLVELIFAAQETGTSEIQIQESSVLLNDGRGTALSHVTKGSFVSVLEGKGEANADTNPPQNLEVLVIPASSEGGTPMMLSFNAIDRESGIASYQIKQQGKWVVVYSPHPVTQKIFQSTISVRAYDTAGNVSEASVRIPGTLPLYVVFGLIALVLLAGFYLYKLIK